MCHWHLLPHISLRALAKLLQCTSSYKIAVFQFSWRKLRQVQTWFWHVTKVQSIIIFRESPENKVIPLVEFQIWSLTKVMNSASMLLKLNEIMYMVHLAWYSRLHHAVWWEIWQGKSQNALNVRNFIYVFWGCNSY